MEKERYQLRRAAGRCWLLDMEQSGAKSGGVISLNESGAFIWEQYVRLRSEDAVAELAAEHFGISREEGLADVRLFLRQLREQELEV